MVRRERRGARKEKRWELKTQARKRVREEAEQAGGLCYYPDGSFKMSRSGWGWVAQQAGRELRSDCGPVRLYGEDEWLGAQYHSNNAGELSGVISVLKDVERHVEKGTLRTSWQTAEEKELSRAHPSQAVPTGRRDAGCELCS